MSSQLPPPSASSFLINVFGGVCYIFSVRIALHFYPDMGIISLSCLALVSALVPIILCEVLILKVHQRPHVGLIKPGPPDRERLSLKLLGYYGSIAFVMFLYAIIPMYSADPFYQASFAFMLPLLLIYIFVGWIYMTEFDTRFKYPYDAYWHVGNLLAGRFENCDRSVLFSHLRSLILRAYFIPVMLAYTAMNTDLLINGHEDYVGAYFADIEGGSGLVLLKFIVMAYFFLAVMDVLFAALGYLVMLRVLDSHIRSTDSTFLGWFICIVCYYPFWEVVVISTFLTDFYNNPEWHVWFEGMPVMIGIWGTLVLAGIFFESLTTLTFGIRFSNLTYRGLMSTGLFRLTKHPQYVSKMLNRFFFYVPFLSMAGFYGSFKTMMMFCALCFVYYLRAKTEENHLSRYPEYVTYAYWVNEHGMFRHLTKYAPFFGVFRRQSKTREIILTLSLLKTQKLPGDITSYDIAKACAVLLMIVDHIGFFFFLGDPWWRAIGRLCVPIWFFLIGYAKTRDVPRSFWIGALILLVASVIGGAAIFPLNILITMALIRLCIESVMQFSMKDRDRMWIVCFLLFLLTLPSYFFVEYGTQGLILAMFGYLVRRMQDDKSVVTKRFVEGFLLFALFAFVPLQSLVMGFDYVQATFVFMGVVFIMLKLMRFQSRTYPDLNRKFPKVAVTAIQILGRRSLEIYVLHLALLKIFAPLIGTEGYSFLEWHWL